MTILRRLFEPCLTAPHGPVIWAPEESDPNRQFKRNMIAQAIQVLAAGDGALAGGSFEVPEFGESEFDAVQETLLTDPEENQFFELAVACKNVVQSLARIAAA